jgi:hypothetical protein
VQRSVLAHGTTRFGLRQHISRLQFGESVPIRV